VPRLPKDTDNLTPHHIDLLIEDALKKYERYEQRVDFEWPQEKIDAVYRLYQRAWALCRDYRGFATIEQQKLIDALP
jgi:hypothetical protein